ncbi:MAG: hypothetical protein KAI70_01735 [Candidatus Omnitrophica bacterium]|nr:hypothetical protein [Candidatus Omnitrophota bacterium]
MDFTLFFAKILGSLYAIIGIGILFNMKTYLKVMEDFIENAAIVYLCGVAVFVVGMIIVLNHNVWVLNWPIVITIMGWMAIFKGVFLIVFPDAMVRLTKKFVSMTRVLFADIIFIIMLGCFLMAKGFQLI